MIAVPSRAWWLLGLAFVVPTLLGAQIPVPGRMRMQPQVRRDTTARDTTQRDSLKVRFSEPDSVMSALMNQRGYTVTRYEGKRVTFDATNRAFRIDAGPARTAVVQRGPQTVIADSSITYEQSTKVVSALGNVILSDPTSGQEDIKSCCMVTYNLAERSALIRNPKFAINNGQMWFLTAKTSKVVGGDSATARNSTFYAKGGTITSCDDSIPDYHFEYGDFKKTAGGTIVGRPAVLYIKDIPVMWLPFFFQDARSGRRSGIVTPQFGIADFVRNSPNYRRRLEDLGYYFAINDYMDARVAVDWLSSAGANANDLPGNVKFKGEWSYNWLSRFLRGHIASDYTRFRNGDNNFAVSWNHGQEFSRDARISADINYVKNTTLQRQNTVNPYVALATIRSSLNYSNKFGPATLQLGGQRTQYPGRTQIEQAFPNLSINSAPINVGSWLVWTPTFSYSLNQTLHMDAQVPLPFNFFTNPVTGLRDSSRVNAHRSNSTLSFQTPIRIFGYDLRNSFTVNEDRENFPRLFELRDVETGEVTDRRVFAENYTTQVDWTPDFQLPPLFRSLFNVTPGVSLSNIESGPFWVRSSLTNGQWVHQGKRPSFSLSASPAIFGLIPGVGPFERFRHSIQPSIAYSYAPAATVPKEYLRAFNRTAAGNLTGLQSNSLSFGLNTSLEAKVRSQLDTNPDASEKIKLLSLQFSPLSYDFDRARKTGRAIRGLTNDQFSYTLTTDLIPNFDFSVNYSLFEGLASQDSARFKPFRTGVSARLNLTDKQNPFAVFTRLFGRAVPTPSPNIAPSQPDQQTDQQLQRQVSSQPVAGSQTSGRQFLVPPPEGWTASFTFSSSRQRPPAGNVTNVIVNDPATRCAQFAGQPFVFQECVNRAQLQPAGDSIVTSSISGGTIVLQPPVTSIGASTSFRLTQKWSASWQTSYDVERHEFASQIVSLQRDLHDWRATFGFTQSPNGNFAFTFFIALKAEPDLKFDYNRATYRGGSF